MSLACTIMSTRRAHRLRAQWRELLTSAPRGSHFTISPVWTVDPKTSCLYYGFERQLTQHCANKCTNNTSTVLHVCRVADGRCVDSVSIDLGCVNTAHSRKCGEIKYARNQQSRDTLRPRCDCVKRDDQKREPCIVVQTPPGLLHPSGIPMPIWDSHRR